MLTHLRIGENVEPSTNALDETLPLQPAKAFSGDAMGIKITRTEHSMLPNYVSDLLPLQLAHWIPLLQNIGGF